MVLKSWAEKAVKLYDPYGKGPLGIGLICGNKWMESKTSTVGWNLNANVKRKEVWKMKSLIFKHFLAFVFRWECSTSRSTLDSLALPKIYDSNSLCTYSWALNCSNVFLNHSQCFVRWDPNPYFLCHPQCFVSKTTWGRAHFTQRSDQSGIFFSTM